MNRRLALALAAALLPLPSFAADPNYPSRPIRLVVGFPPGGGADGIARLLADHMSQTLKQPVVVENKPGANTTLAPAFVAAAPADGYTLLLGPDSVLGTDKLLFASTVKYDESNFTPINRVASTFFVLAANKDLGIRRFSDVVAKSSQQPLFLASPGGPYLQIILSEVRRQSSAKLDEVLYRGGAQGALAVMSGESALTLMGPGALLPLVRDGKLVAVATTNDRVSSLAPGVPTLADDGVTGFKLNFWYGIMGPAGLPDDVVRKIFDASSAAAADPAVKQKLALLGYEAVPAASPEAFRASALQDGATLKSRAQAAGIKPQ
jgi:tripartite-type tricarboxylate transporter receptor subunit TctC